MPRSILVALVAAGRGLGPVGSEYEVEPRTTAPHSRLDDPESIRRAIRRARGRPS